MEDTIRTQVRISDRNFKKLARIVAEQGVSRGAVIDEALNLFFLPPIERPDAILVQHINRLENKLSKLDAGAAFQADLLVEFIYAWLQQRPGPHPLRAPSDDARAGAELEALMKRVADRSNPYIWG